MSENSHFFRGVTGKLSKEEQQARRKIFFCVVGLILFLGVIFFIGQILQMVTSDREILIQEMQTGQQFIFARGQAMKVFPTEESVYLTTPDAAYCMMRKLPSWKVVQPERITQEEEILLGIDQKGVNAFFQQGEFCYIKNMETEEMESLTPPETGIQFARVDFCADGKKFLAETTGGSEGEIWQWDMEKRQWEKVAEGTHAEYTSNGRSIYYERQGEIFSLDFSGGTEKKVANGFLPALSNKGNYLAYVTNDPESGQEVILICRTKEPEETFRLTGQHLAENEGESPFHYQDLSWEHKKNALYVVSQKEEEESTTVKYYTLSDLDQNPTAQSCVWLEGCMMGDQEAIQTIYAQDPYQDEMQMLQDHGLGFYATDKESGLESNGMYQRISYQMVFPEEGNLYETWNEKLFFNTGSEGYWLDRYLSREKEQYWIEDGQFYQQNHAIAQEETVADALWGSYNSGHDEFFLIQERNGRYQAVVLDEKEKYKEIPLDFPAGAEPYCVSFSKSGHVGAIFYHYEDTQGILIVNLKKNYSIDSDFLMNIQKGFWENNQLILYSGDNNLNVRWVYAPSEGTLRLME